MKSILLVTIEYPPQLGGIATYLAHMAENLPHGDICVLAPEGPDTHRYDMEAGVPIYRRGLLWRYMRPRWLPAFYWTWWLCRRERPSMLVVSHLLNMGKVAIGIKRFLRIPYTVILHGFDVAQAASVGGRRRAAAKEILANAALVICNSGYTAFLAKTLGIPETRIATVNPPPWLPLDESADMSEVAAFRKKHGLEGKFVLLTVSRLVERKGIDTCIDAVAALRAAGRDVKYVVVGEGLHKGHLKHRAAQMNVADDVIFLGALDTESLPVAYAACDVFVMVPRGLKSGDIEGFGIVYLEANIFGKPVIGSRTGGVPEAVIHEKTGLLIEPDSPSQLAEAVAALMDNSTLRQDLGEGGRQRLKRDYGDNRQARRFLAAVKRATGESKTYAK